MVECRSKVTTKSGKLHNNSYYMVCRWDDGKLRMLAEDMDTELGASALGPT